MNIPSEVCKDILPYTTKHMPSNALELLEIIFQYITCTKLIATTSAPCGTWTCEDAGKNYEEKELPQLMSKKAKAN